MERQALITVFTGATRTGKTTTAIKTAERILKASPKTRKYLLCCATNDITADHDQSPWTRIFHTAEEFFEAVPGDYQGNGEKFLLADFRFAAGS